MRYFTLLIICLSSLLLIGCGNTKILDTDILPFVQKFEAFYGQSIDYSVTFVEGMDNNWVGVCWMYGNGAKKVEINKSYWSDATDNEKEELVYHELGHCTLNREHLSTKIAYKNSSIPLSIMYPYVFGHASYYEERKEEYIEELFDKGTGIRTITSIPTDGDVVIYN